MERDGRAQAKVLLRLVDEMLEETGRRPRDLDAVVVGTGPGTFTGVRITVATARALSLALSVPVLGVSTLGALAAAGAAIDDRCQLLVPVVDARRGQLFYGLYRPAGAGSPSGTRRWVRSTEFGVCDRGALGGVVTAAANDRSGRTTLRPDGRSGQMVVTTGTPCPKPCWSWGKVLLWLISRLGPSSGAPTSRRNGC